MTTQSIVERQDFSIRLKTTLANLDYPYESPTTLAREFNARFAGDSITVHAARKWLVGEAIPTQEKMRTLAQWLGTSPEWLRFGDGNGEAAAPDLAASSYAGIVADLQRLDEASQQLARDFVRLLIRRRGTRNG